TILLRISINMSIVLFHITPNTSYVIRSYFPLFTQFKQKSSRYDLDWKQSIFKITANENLQTMTLKR
ncbi:MAG TPA: hypothetical protein PLM36_15280, partial [Leptospiraceae bacterium]|nr:hypothetical protein [Leptospiraceae bacterium]HMY32417.1 hypothetical protein [Leptospiraceae bacterium]HNF56066.1 hypothetical protein [Leptospiraceae bacterium]HNH57094.1 hypothetical protein [Leptospiraceae bacterium]HNK59700.1 hypothetical protein [Leptospiraceae bacterium]